MNTNVPVIGTAVASYHVPGAQVIGQAIKQNEKVIYVDQSLIAPVFLADWDEAVNHFDVRDAYSRKLAQALSIKLDKNLLQLAVLAARASATITGGNGGSQLTDANYRTDAAALAAGIFDAAQKFDEKDVPEDGRHVAVKPAQYNLLVQNTDLINKLWGGSGAYSDGKIFRIANMEIVKTNHLPTSLIASATGENNTYNADFSNTAFVAWQDEAVATVKVKDLMMETDGYTAEYQGTLMLAKYMLG